MNKKWDELRKAIRAAIWGFGAAPSDERDIDETTGIIMDLVAGYKDGQLSKLAKLVKALDERVGQCERESTKQARLLSARSQEK